MSGGFEWPTETATIEFGADHKLHGLEIEVRLNVPLDYYFKILGFEELLDGDVREFLPLLHEFAEKCLVSWNLEKAGKPVPATADAFTSLIDLNTGTQILGQWIALIGRVPDPLAPRSASGATSGVKRPRNQRRSSKRKSAS